MIFSGYYTRRTSEISKNDCYIIHKHFIFYQLEMTPYSLINAFVSQRKNRKKETGIEENRNLLRII